MKSSSFSSKGFWYAPGARTTSVFSIVSFVSDSGVSKPQIASCYSGVHYSWSMCVRPAISVLSVSIKSSELVWIGIFRGSWLYWACISLILWRAKLYFGGERPRAWRGDCNYLPHRVFFTTFRALCRSLYDAAFIMFILIIFGDFLWNSLSRFSSSFCRLFYFFSIYSDNFKFTHDFNFLCMILPFSFWSFSDWIFSMQRSIFKITSLGI